MSEPGALGLGTLGLDPDTLRGIIEEAGFTSMRILEADDPVHHYYEVRP